MGRGRGVVGTCEVYIEGYCEGGQVRGCAGSGGLVSSAGGLFGGRCACLAALVGWGSSSGGVFGSSGGDMMGAAV